MTEKGQVKITTAKPIVGKKVFYLHPIDPC